MKSGLYLINVTFSLLVTLMLYKGLIMNDLKIKSSKLTDEDIIENILNGDINLYEILIRRYNQRLYRIGKGFFKDDNEIEEVMQFSYVKAFEKLSAFKKRSAFPTWLTRIFINEALARKRYKERFVHSPDNDDDNEDLFFEKKEMNTPEKSTVNNELKELLETAIASLPEKYRIIFVMHELENISVHETGEFLNLTESNVKVRLNRARKMLRDNLSRFYSVEDIYSFNLVRCDVVVHNVFKIINPQNSSN